jgi:hypothetical protein
LLTAQITATPAALATATPNAVEAGAPTFATTATATHDASVTRTTPQFSLSTPETQNYISFHSERSDAGSALHSGATLPQITLTTTRPFDFALPTGAFIAPPGTSITVEARLADGRPLPSWLKFDPESGRFSGEPPPGQREALNVVVIARDTAGHQATLRIQMQFAAPRDSAAHAPGDAPTPSAQQSGQAEHARPAGKPSLAQQFARYGDEAWQRELNEWLRAAAQRATEEVT